MLFFFSFGDIKGVLPDVALPPVDTQKPKNIVTVNDFTNNLQDL